MKKSQFKVSLLIIVLMSFINPAFSEYKREINFLTTNYCPLICENEDHEGIMVDIARAIFEPLGFKINISFRPFKRALQENTNGHYDGFIGGNKEQLKNNLFPQYVTTPNRTILYKRSGLNWSYSGPGSLKKVTLVSVKGFKYGNTHIDNFVAKKNNINLVTVPVGNHIEKMTKLLVKKRGDVFAAGELTTQYKLKASPLRKKIIPDPAIVGTFHNYISIHPNSKRAKRLISIINRRFERMYDDGSLKRIYLKYGIRTQVDLISE
jgi:polar amino acid transport system substrate-binding protein